MVAAAVRVISAQPDAEHVRDRLDVIIATMLGRQLPKVETMCVRTATYESWSSSKPVRRAITRLLVNVITTAASWFTTS